MSDYPWQRALILALLGMGVFFILVGLLGLLAWLATGGWRAFLREIVLVAALATMPVASYFWERYVVKRL